jgi:hypothetical protein
VVGDDRTEDPIVKKFIKEVTKSFYPDNIITEEFYQDIMSQVSPPERDAKTQAPEVACG